MYWVTKYFKNNSTIFYLDTNKAEFIMEKVFFRFSIVCVRRKVTSIMLKLLEYLSNYINEFIRLYINSEDTAKKVD